MSGNENAPKPPNDSPENPFQWIQRDIERMHYQAAMRRVRVILFGALLFVGVVLVIYSRDITHIYPARLPSDVYLDGADRKAAYERAQDQREFLIRIAGLAAAAASVSYFVSAFLSSSTGLFGVRAPKGRDDEGGRTPPQNDVTPAGKARARFNQTRRRLRAEVRALGKRSIVNLGFGAAATVAAVGILATSIVSKLGGTLDATTLVSIYGVRLALALFIEAFAFFFLRLYRENLQDIRYYQNELTNVEARAAALEICQASPESEIVKSVVAGLTTTERNFVLKRDESTLDLRRVEAETRAWREAAKALGSTAKTLVRGK
jgi:hypothetical protein